MIQSLTAGLLAMALAFPVAAQETEDFDPATVDLAKLVECRTYDVPSYNGFAFWLAGTDGAEAREHLGLTEVKTDNFLLKQYRLAAPISVFGRTTRLVAFNSSGPLAVLDEADPHPLAQQLEIEPAIDVPNKFLGEKVISETNETVGDTRFGMRVTLNVSTVSSHPGTTLAGCSYRLEVE